MQCVQAYQKKFGKGIEEVKAGHPYRGKGRDGRMHVATCHQQVGGVVSPHLGTNHFLGFFADSDLDRSHQSMGLGDPQIPADSPAIRFRIF